VQAARKARPITECEIGTECRCRAGW
jgi:hypothetical protein